MGKKCVELKSALRHCFQTRDKLTDKILSLDSLMTKVYPWQQQLCPPKLTYSNVHTLYIDLHPHICIILLTRWARCNHDNSHCPTDSIPSIHPCACVCGPGHQSLTHHTYTQTRLGPWVQDARLRQFMSYNKSQKFWLELWSIQLSAIV